MHANPDHVTVTAGRAEPLGASVTDHGVNFALFSAHAEAVDLCLFDSAGERRLRLPARTGDIWHGHVAGLRPGQPYGYRVHGPYEPEAGHRFNPAKLLIDPYARALDGRVADHGSIFGYDGRTRRASAIDSAPAVPKSIVVPPRPEPRRPRDRPWRTNGGVIIYEAHVRGLTMRFPGVPDDLRGTFAGLTCEPVLAHLREIGVTAIELLPVHAFHDERFLTAAGRVNYWGYNSIAFFAADRRYAATPVQGTEANPTAEFRAMVDRLHDAGLEVILDVVYNHTGEGNHLGPTLMFRGIDNASYYRLEPGDRRRYVNDTGTGNTLNTDHPAVRRLVVDSLRYWANDMGVDGFRFDLASTLARRADGFDAGHPLLREIVADPLLADIRLIAEPWDVGPGGYRLGEFPPPFYEWNDRFRDTMRRFWRGDNGMAAEFATRIAGSADLFDRNGRSTASSVNFVTAHDGFTLADLVSHARKHNEANGEDNRDGHGGNHSVNHGVEGPSDDPVIRAERDRHRRNLLTCLLLAQGTPMLLAGDEAGNSQSGNNNAYCQDNDIGWVDWRGLETDEGRDFLAFVRRLTALRHSYPVLRQAGFLHARERPGDGLPDLAWFRTNGKTPTSADWHDPRFRQFSVVMRGAAESGDDVGPAVAILVNRAAEGAYFRVPPAGQGRHWSACVDTASSTGLTRGETDALPFGAALHVADNSLLVLIETAGPGAERNGS